MAVSSEKAESNTVCFGDFFEDSESELSFPPSIVSEVRQPLPCTRPRTILDTLCY